MVNLLSCSFEKFQEKANECPMICFGAGQVFKRLFVNGKFQKIINNVQVIIDNDSSKWGREIERIPLISWQEALDRKFSKNTILLITNNNFDEVLEQLDHCPAFDGFPCYVSLLIENTHDSQKINLNKGGDFLIPPVIHYCWFGGKEIPDVLKRYMDSWHKFCPNHEIRKWDETNYDITANNYMKQAYDAGFWGFVPDYARLDIIYNYGGIYLDTDVELLKPLDDMRSYRMFCGFESEKVVNLGQGFGACRENETIGKMREAYSELSFRNADGSYNLLPSPHYQSEILEGCGFQMNGRYQQRNEEVIFPAEVFSPANLYRNIQNITENSYSIHHFAATWYNEAQKAERDKMEIKLEHIMQRVDSGCNNCVVSLL